jgi:hypothetical protein
MATSAIPNVLSYLVDTFTASTRLGAATPAVQVFDGGLISDDHPPLSLVVGANDMDVEFLPEGATAQQKWVGPGNRKRDENLTVWLVAEAWTGDGTLRAVRNSAFGIVSAVEDLTRVDANLGGTVLFTDSGVNNLTFRQDYTDRGPLARVVFSIDCFARIGT